MPLEPGRDWTLTTPLRASPCDRRGPGAGLVDALASSPRGSLAWAAEKRLARVRDDRARLRGPGRQGGSELVRGGADAAMVEGEEARLDRRGGPLAADGSVLAPRDDAPHRPRTVGVDHRA